MAARDGYLLELSEVSKRFGGLSALEGVSMGVGRGEVRGIIGPNGAGKTTLFNIITGELKPTQGKVFLEGEEITGISPHLICRKGVGRTFQLTLIFPEMTVFDCVWAGANSQLKGLWRLFFSKVSPSDEASHSVMQILEQVGLEDKAEELACNLSYGDQKVLEIAMALSTRPKILLLDEPTQGVGPQEAEGIARLIRALATNTSILLIEHDMNMVLQVCDRITVLNFGSAVAEGSWEEISSDQEVQRIYLGEKSWSF
jgi:ABC-type branched-subunit amino acid transport system ATPase component